jgi:hypothetical protein
MHSRQASKFALYRAQTPNRGKYRGKGLEFVTGEMRDSEGRSLLIRRHCIGYVVFDTLYLTLYPTLYHVLYTGLYRSVVPCTLYPGLYRSLYRSAVSYTTPCTLVYKHKKPLGHVHRRGRRYRTKKYPAKRKPRGVCNERDVNPYSVEGVEVNAPSIPAIVIVTSPINIDPNDCSAVNSAFPA